MCAFDRNLYWNASGQPVLFGDKTLRRVAGGGPGQEQPHRRPVVRGPGAGRLPAAAGLPGGEDRLRAVGPVGRRAIGEVARECRVALSPVSGPVLLRRRNHPAREGEGVGPCLRIHDGHVAVVLASSVPRREGRRDHLARAGDRLRIEHGDARMQVAEEHRLARAIRIRGPEVVNTTPRSGRRTPSGCRGRGHRAAPTACCRAALLLESGRMFAAIRVAAMEDRDLRGPAVHPAPAAARTEDDAAVGQIGRLDVVPGAVGELPQAGCRRPGSRGGGSSASRPCGRRTGSSSRRSGPADRARRRWGRRGGPSRRPVPRSRRQSFPPSP